VKIEVRSRIPADVLIDGVPQGTTPWTSTISPGIHNIGVNTPDQPFHDSKRLTVKAGPGTVKLYFKGISAAAPPERTPGAAPKSGAAAEHAVTLELANLPAFIRVDGRALTTEKVNQYTVLLKEGLHQAEFDLLTEGPPRVEKRSFEVRPETTRVTFTF
jgi:hypothetical protein